MTFDELETAFCTLEDALTSPYTCTVCGKRYKPTEASLSVSCAVFHQPGTCCHYNEEEISMSTSITQGA